MTLVARDASSHGILRQILGEGLALILAGLGVGMLMALPGPSDLLSG
jgi:hypothetical protein